MSITIDINTHCNLHCAHCFSNSSDNPKRKDIVDYLVLKNALEESISVFGCRFFSISGGEPFMSLERLIQLLSDFHYIPFQIFTNGTLLDDKALKSIERHPNAVILVSIEGDEIITDKIRGSGTYSLVSKAFQRLNNSSILYGASITVTNDNYEYVSSQEFAEILKEFGCFYVWIFDYKAIGRATNKDLVLRENNRKQFNKRISFINKHYPFIILNSEKDPDAIGGCPATKGSVLHISATGGVTPCIAVRHSHPQLNINHNSLNNIFNSEIFKDYRNIGCLKGCAERHEPEQYKKWVEHHELGPMY